jgi:hypothetical protein
MFHVKHLSATLLLLMVMLCCAGQLKPHPVLEGRYPMVQAVMDSTMLSVEVKQFTTVERQVLYLMNLARMRPQLFRDSVLNPYLKANPDMVPIYGESLSRELLAAKALSPLYAGATVRSVASAHARDIARSGNISHYGSDGNGPAERLNAAGIFCASECIHYSNYPFTVQMVLSLLIDKDVAGVGHRRAMLAAGNNKAGVSVVKAKDGMNVLVINMSCD